MRNGLLLSFLGLALLTGPADTAPRPNFVFFIADDMVPEMFNCLPEGKGKNLTPHLDRLAAEGVLMTGQHVVSPVCTPSRYNCLTGRYASRARNEMFLASTAAEGQTRVEFNSYLTPKDVTLPSLLQQAGYLTGLVGKNHVIEVPGLDTRFANYDANARDPKISARLRHNHDKVCAAVRQVGFDFAASVYNNNPDFLGLYEVAVQNMDWITAGALDFIDRAGERPFFLWVATTVPHDPVEPKRSWNANPLITAQGYLDAPLEVQPARSTIPPRLKAAGLELTDERANMLWLDDGLGAILAKLKHRGLLDNTIVFFFSDHGQNAKGTLYQGGVHDPSIVWKQGGFPAGSKCAHLISNVDFAPTILDMAGVKPEPGQFDGTSFLPALEGRETEQGRVLYHELGYTRALRKGKWKYLALRYPEKYANMSREERKRVLDEWNANRIRKHMRIVTEDPDMPFSHLTPIPGGGDAERRSTGAYPGYYDADQLYDLEADPGERVNLANDPEHQEVLKALKQELRTRVRSLGDTFGEFGH